jgi:hypothetical protein
MAVGLELGVWTPGALGEASPEQVAVFCAAVATEVASMTLKEVQETDARWAAFAEYGRRAGHSAKQLGAVSLRIKARLGVLLLESKPYRACHGDNQHSDPKPTLNDLGVTKTDAFQCERIAAHPDVMEKVISESSDQRPPSMRKVLEAIKELSDAGGTTVNATARKALFAAVRVKHPAITDKEIGMLFVRKHFSQYPETFTEAFIEEHSPLRAPAIVDVASIRADIVRLLALTPTEQQPDVMVRLTAMLHSVFDSTDTEVAA